MSLVIDHRATLQGQAGVHALIVGVSHYPFLAGGETPVGDPWGMGQLTSAASTAAKIVQWAATARFPVPLATCRVLLSPSPTETPGVTAEEATLENLLREADAWRSDAAGHRDSMTMFYFAGHGVQRTKEDAVLCLNDFRKPPGPSLMHAVDVATIRAGMSPSPPRPNIARTQLYFVDACRVRPEEFAKFDTPQTTALFERELAGEDDRAAPVFYSAISNKLSFGQDGQTLFSRALLFGLSGGAGDPLDEDAAGRMQYGVTVTGLIERLPDLIDDQNQRFGADQTFTTGGQVLDRRIVLLEGPPTVEVLLNIDPAQAATDSSLSIQGDEGLVLTQVAPLGQLPFTRRIPAGVYTITLSFQPGHPTFVNHSAIKSASAPRSEWKMRV